MTIREQKKWLLFLNLALAAAIVVGVGLGLLLPLSGQENAPVVKSAPATNPSGSSKLGPRNEYAVIYRKSLRGALYAAAVSSPKLSVKLVGTMMDPDFTCGVFVNRSGEQTMVSVGQTIDGAQVVAIHDGSVTLQYGDQTIVLTVQKKEDQ